MNWYKTCMVVFTENADVAVYIVLYNEDADAMLFNCYLHNYYIN